MKFKLTCGSLAIIIIAFSTLSFTNVSKLGWTVYYYHPSGDKTLIAPGQTNSLVSSEIVSPGYWNSTYIAHSAWGTKLAAIQFKEDDQADGTGDDAITITEAINSLEEYYISQNPNDLPDENTPIHVQLNSSQYTDIYVYRKE